MTEKVAHEVSLKIKRSYLKGKGAKELQKRVKYMQRSRGIRKQCCEIQIVKVG